MFKSGCNVKINGVMMFIVVDYLPQPSFAPLQVDFYSSQN